MDINLDAPRKLTSKEMNWKNLPEWTETEDLYDGTDTTTAKFKRMVESRVQFYKKNGQEPNYYLALRNSLFFIYLPDMAFTWLTSTIAECASIGYCYILADLIRYLKDPNIDNAKGTRTIAMFISCMVIS